MSSHSQDSSASRGSSHSTGKSSGGRWRSSRWPGRSRGVPHVVIGRAWSRYQPSWAWAASMSTAAPKADSTARHRRTSSSSTSSRSARPVGASPRRELDDRAAGLVDDDRVGRHRARDHRLAEPGDRVDQDLVGPPGDRMAGERDGRGLGRDERLDHDGHRTAVRGQAPARPIGDRASAPQRRPAAQHGRRDLVGAQAELGVVEAGERRAGAILGDGGGADRETGGRSRGRERRHREPGEWLRQRGRNRCGRAVRRASRRRGRRGSVRRSARPGRTGGPRPQASPSSCAVKASVVRQNPGGMRNPARASRLSDAPLPPTRAAIDLGAVEPRDDLRCVRGRRHERQALGTSVAAGRRRRPAFGCGSLAIPSGVRLGERRRLTASRLQSTWNTSSIVIHHAPG